MRKFLFFILALVTASWVNSQNEAQKWYFGTRAGLDFSTSPPTALTNGSIVTSEGCAAISNSAGNLLFYTDGSKIWDQTHAVMANGTGMTGNSSTTQSALIVRQPGSSIIYYVFTLGASGSGSLCFSTVDMSLAAGNGSVTIKNTLLATNMTEKLTSVKHCNGKDVWVLAHDNNSDAFRAYLVTNSGVNSTPVITNYGTVHSGGPGVQWLGNMKASPNGRRLGLAIHGMGAFEIYDFDNSTGVVSNSLSLTNACANAYGLEFSSDGSKLYGTREFGFNGFYQWDLCAGSNTAIIASQYSELVPTQLMGLQLAIDGKIYVARSTSSVLAVINNPNVGGVSCNYVHNGQTIAPKTSQYGLPNFINSFFEQPPQSFSVMVTCASVSFSTPALTSTISNNCSAVSFSPVTQSWNFGDPASGAANTSTLSNPVHAYPAPGAYSVMLVLNFPCRTDTIKQVVNANTSPSLAIAGNFTMCTGEKRTYTVSGTHTYTWSNTATTQTVLLFPSGTAAYSVVGTNTVTGCTATKLFTISVFKCQDLGERRAEKQIFQIYPNPFYDVLTVKAEDKTELYILNQLGKPIHTVTLEPGINKLDLAFLSPGLYLFKTSGPNGNTQCERAMKMDKP